MDPRERVPLDRFSPQLGITAAVLCLTVIYAALQVAYVRTVPQAAVTRESIIVRPPDVRAAGAGERAAALGRWRDDYWSGATRQSAGRRPGMVVQVAVFTIAALVLLLLRSSDLTAQLSVLALALSAVAGGGPLFGAEGVLPFGIGGLVTVFTWLAGPFAFPIAVLAILNFPTPSALLRRHASLHWVPFLVASPMIAVAGGTALYLVGVDRVRPLALWDAAHPGVFFGSFAAALVVNVLAIFEGLYRFRHNPDVNQRRRVRMAVYTAVPGVLAFAVKDGTPIVASLAGVSPPAFARPAMAVLQGLVLLPAFGLTYAVGVARVLGPRIVLRRSLQYALASRTLTVVAVLPAAALVVTLFRKNLSEIVTSGSAVYLGLFGASIAALHYRDRARQWLDERFFREEYDARKILMSLASRVRFETDPADLSTMVVRQIEEALHPERVAMLVSGVEEGRLTPIARLGGDLAPLPLDGGVVTMLRWSDEPLEIFMDDPRSPARRLPAAEVAWIEATGTSLIVPVLGQDRSLVGALALGGKRSEEAYTTEDRQLLATIAAQLGLGLDAARLRRRPGETAEAATAMVAPASEPPMTECPRCGRCEDAGVAICPADGAAMTSAGGVPRVLDNKFRMEQLIGRGGMGAVYRARDMRLDRLVAVKVVRADLLQDPEARRRFRREAQIVARLQHPGIVSIFDYGTFADGGAYLVMELVRGEDLRRVLQREGRVEPAPAARILNGVCQAIAAAHREGVLHRDLKPENILLSGSGLEAKVLDFGVAKLVADRGDDTRSGRDVTLTAAGSIVGTPAYMAPEQLRGAPPDPRTDVFALGVIAYEMIAGELPFGRGSLADVILAHERGPRPFDAVGVRVPPALEEAIVRALDRDPDRRPPSPLDFAAAVVQAAGSGEPS